MKDCDSCQTLAGAKGHFKTYAFWPSNLYNSRSSHSNPWFLRSNSLILRVRIYVSQVSYDDAIRSCNLAIQTSFSLEEEVQAMHLLVDVKAEMVATHLKAYKLKQAAENNRKNATETRRRVTELLDSFSSMKAHEVYDVWFATSEQKLNFAFPTDSGDWC